MRRRSTLLALVGFGRFGKLGHVIGDIVTVQSENPEFVCIHQLTITIKDDRGQIIDNHGLPTGLALEIH